MQRIPRMYDATFHPATLKRHLRKSDFDRDPKLVNPAHLASILNTATLIGQNGLASITLGTATLANKTVYRVTHFPDEIALRHLTANIRRVTGVKQDNRNYITTCIRRLLYEGTPFVIHKLDIKGFYESVDVRFILRSLESDPGFSEQSITTLATFFSCLNSSSISGLPRGLSLSATLSEYLLRSFDEEVRSREGVWYYSRFVDDMVIITEGKKTTEFFNSLSLPAALTFNPAKSKFYPFSGFIKGQPLGTEHAFNFLGYSYAVGIAYRHSGNEVSRKVIVDIADSKVRKLKTRIAKSLAQFKLNNDYALLLDRFRMLTSNYVYHDLKSDSRRLAGIYYNYPMIDPDASLSLKSLDKFAQNSLSSPHSLNRLFPTVTKAQRIQLLRLSFTRGHRERRFFAFSPQRLAEIVSCWSYV